MNLKRLISLALCMSLVSLPALNIAAKDDTKVEKARQVEYLTRGGYGIKTDSGVYLSWRLLGTEPIDQTFDIILDKPETSAEDNFTYEFNDAAIGDVDNDGEFEFIIKWDPTNRQDNSVKGYTGNVLIDCYKQDGTKLWRIDLGKNIRAGSHYTQIIVYDFDGDGKAEMALRTAPGSKDGNGDYVSAAAKDIEIDGVSYPLTWEDEYTHEVYTDESDIRDIKGSTIGKILHGPDWLTMFNGETGAAMSTVNYYPQRGDVNTWGDNYANRSERYNAGVAYLDGEHPSLFTARGYYTRAAMAAYDWNGESFIMRWHRDDKAKGANLYGNGNHQISVCDADNDGKDEIVFGSTVVDNDGSILNSTDHGHGDALHVSDFNNDGEQEIFQVHEEKSAYQEYGAEVRKASDAAILGKVGATDDVGRGLMANFDDEINDESEFFSSADSNSYNMSGTQIGAAPTRINPSFLVWWDGDLAREIFGRTTINKYDIKTNTRIDVKSFENVHFGDKDAPALSADLLGDWREEICYATEDNSTLRIFMTTTPTDYKMPTLLHDTQYREAIAWQNVGYNQPPHPKFYVGKAALNANGKYLEPETGFDTVSTTNAPTIEKPTPTEKPTTTHTVNISAMGDIYKTFNTYTNVPYGDSLSYTYPRFIVEDGIAYGAQAAQASSSTHFGGSITHVIKDQDVKINYTQTYGGVVYFEDFNTDTGRSAAIRASDGKGFTTDKKIETDYKLKHGRKYKQRRG